MDEGLSHKRQILLVILVGLMFVVPALLLRLHWNFRLDSDYDASIANYAFFFDFLRENHTIPLINPYISTGIPIFGDPANAVLNPMVMVPVGLFGVETGIRLVILFSVLLSGISMWWFLRSLYIDGWVRVWGAALYELAGGLASRIVAGHIEKVLSYPLVPLFLLVAFQQKKNIKECLLASGVLTLCFFSGDIYTPWFLIVFLLCIDAYFLVTHRSGRLRVIGDTFFIFFFAGIVSAPKTAPYFLFVSSHIERFSTINPYAGSIHTPFAILPYIVPFDIFFYERPRIKLFFGFFYNCYEYFNFISPLSLISLIFLPKLLKKEIVRILLVVFIVAMFYVALQFPYSPFYWLFHAFPFLSFIRVPSRILMVATPVLIALCAFGFRFWLSEGKTVKQNRIIYSLLISSVLWTGFVSARIIMRSFEPTRIREQLLIKELRAKDRSNFYILNFSCCMQEYLVHEKIPTLNYYYSWRPKGIPNYVAQDGTSDFSSLRAIRPKYIIAPNTMDFHTYSYNKFFSDITTTVWRTTSVTIVPSLR